MKYLVKIFVVTFFLILSTHTFAEQKIVVLDMKYVLNNSKAGKGAQDFLKKSFKDNAKKFSDLEKELKKEESDLLGKKNILSKEDYTKKSDNLRKKVIDFQSQRRATLDKIATQRSKSREILIKAIEPIVDAYINENKISMVIDKKNVIGGLNEYDITNIIVEKLNKELPSIKIE
tara:strand:+ start:3964 stop:4488 length:525 start_codon:yes stop_codon:yes gene_type:complete